MKTDRFILDCIKNLKAREIGPPYFAHMPCGKKVWFDARGRILASSQAPCVRLRHDRLWRKNAMDMSPGEYRRARKRMISRG